MPHGAPAAFSRLRTNNEAVGLKNIGGQAVIEGVMMKGELGWSVAVRDPAGTIQVKNTQLKPMSKAWKLPILRGVVTLFHTLVIGIKALEFSASLAGETPEDKPLSKTAIAITIGVSILLAVGLFILLPLYMTKLVGLVYPSVDKSSVLFNAVDGVARVIVFLLYVGGIGLWGEIRRVFEYHGAEHKVIHAFERHEGMDAATIAKHSPLHPRCGTSFLMIVMVVSIVVFAMIPQAWPLVYKFLARVVLIPLIAGLSYEALKMSAKYKDNALMRIMIWPGIALQRLTTREPDDRQIEVALRALNEVLAMEENNKAESVTPKEEGAGAPDIT